MQDHEHAHHAHVRTDDTRRLTLALALILGLMAGEVVAGILASSLALLSDAAHMLTDAFAIALALFAARLARRPAGAHRRALARLLKDRFGVTHSTLQVETRHEGPLAIQPLERGSGA